MKLISYGLGNKFSPRKFKPVRNRTAFNKPTCGLWASPVRSKYGWKHWCQGNNFYLGSGFKTKFVFEIQGKILKIDSKKDALNLPWCEPSNFPGYYFIDFESLAKEYDAIWLTCKGEQETRWGLDDDMRKSLYGWDCESVLVLRKGCVL